MYGQMIVWISVHVEKSDYYHYSSLRVAFQCGFRKREDAPLKHNVHLIKDGLSLTHVNGPALRTGVDVLDGLLNVLDPVAGVWMGAEEFRRPITGL